MYLDTDTRYLNVSIDTILDTFLFAAAFISFKTPYGLEQGWEPVALWPHAAF